MFQSPSNNIMTLTILDKIVHAIRELKDPGKGSSRRAIAKYIKSEFDYDNGNAIKRAFKTGVSNGTLIQSGQSFRVAADPVVPKEKEDDEKVLIEELDSGSGQEYAENLDRLTVSYRGTLDNGYEFDDDSKFIFTLGGGEVIKGWDIGFQKMKVGAKRRLIVPSRLGYGKRGCKPDIPPNAKLHFVVTLRKIEKGE